MLLRALQLSGVRNLAPAVLEPGPRFNVFVGDNGQGKTNLLEAIYVVGALRSFRTQRLAELIAFGAAQAKIGARVDRRGLERLYEIELGEHARKVHIDGKGVRPIAKYFGGFNVVLFAPEDLAVPRGEPAPRRRFLDRAVFVRNAGYLADAQRYDRVLRSRNAVLRAHAERRTRPADAGALLEVYDRQLAEHGARVMCARRRYLTELEPRFAAAFEAITHSGLPAELTYVTAASSAPASVQALAPASVQALAPASVQALAPALDDEAALAHVLAEQLAASRARDLARGSTLVGPHRDDLELRLAGRSAAAYASQGQLRALVLAWKTAEMEVLAAAHGEQAVLLLDDVSSELDATRNEYLFAFLRARSSQCFVTTTHRRHVLVSGDRCDFELQEGRIRPIS